MGAEAGKPNEIMNTHKKPLLDEGGKIILGISGICVLVGSAILAAIRYDERKTAKEVGTYVNVLKDYHDGHKTIQVKHGFSYTLEGKNGAIADAVHSAEQMLKVVIVPGSLHYESVKERLFGANTVSFVADAVSKDQYAKEQAAKMEKLKAATPLADLHYAGKRIYSFVTKDSEQLPAWQAATTIGKFGEDHPDLDFHVISAPGRCAHLPAAPSSTGGISGCYSIITHPKKSDAK